MLHDTKNDIYDSNLVANILAKLITLYGQPRLTNKMFVAVVIKISTKILCRTTIFSTNTKNKSKLSIVSEFM